MTGAIRMFKKISFLLNHYQQNEIAVVAWIEKKTRANLNKPTDRIQLWAAYIMEANDAVTKDYFENGSGGKFPKMFEMENVTRFYLDCFKSPWIPMMHSLFALNWSCIQVGLSLPIPIAFADHNGVNGHVAADLSAVRRPTAGMLAWPCPQNGQTAPAESTRRPPVAMGNLNEPSSNFQLFGETLEFTSNPLFLGA